MIQKYKKHGMIAVYLLGIFFTICVICYSYSKSGWLIQEAARYEARERAEKQVAYQKATVVRHAVEMAGNSFQQPSKEPAEAAQNSEPSKELAEVAQNLAPSEESAEVAQSSVPSKEPAEAAQSPSLLMEPAKIAEKMYTNARVSMREAPSAEAGVVQVLKPNICLALVDYEAGWYQVCINRVTEGNHGVLVFGYVEEASLSPEATPISSLNQWGIDLTKEEIDLLADILWVEARGEPYEGQVAVVEVIFNRIISEDSDFPEDDLYGIVSSTRNGLQFESWPLRDTATPGEELYQVIYDCLYGATVILPSTDYVFFSVGRSGNNIIRIGDHHFGTQ